MKDCEITISVVLPTYNRLPQLQKVLEGFASQTYPMDDFEVVVVSDGATDGTNEFLQSVQTSYRLHPFFQKNQGAAAARNNGINQATG